MNLIAWILSGLLAAVMIAAGSSKLFTARSKLLENPKLGYVNDFSDPQLKMIGALELLGGIGLILPWLLDIVRVLTPLAAVGIALLMVGALLTHVRRGELKQALPPNTVLFAVAVAIAAIRFSQL